MAVPAALEGGAGFEPAAFGFAGRCTSACASHPYAPVRKAGAIQLLRGGRNRTSLLLAGDYHQLSYPQEVTSLRNNARTPMGCRVLRHAAQRHPSRSCFILRNSSQRNFHIVPVRKDLGHDLHQSFNIKHCTPPFCVQTTRPGLPNAATPGNAPAATGRSPKPGHFFIMFHLCSEPL